MPTSGNTIIAVSECKLHTVIRFKTISIRDTNVYSGTVIGIVDFERARTYGDVSATHLEMEQGASLNKGSKKLVDVTQQQFLIVDLSNGQVTPFAFEWITTVNGDAEQVEVIDVGATYTIRLYNVTTTEASTALNLLKSNGYVCKLIKRSGDTASATT